MISPASRSAPPSAAACCRATSAPGDVVFGLASSGVHSNGYSLVRRIVERAGLAWSATAPFAPDLNLAKALLTPTRIYVKPLLAALKATPHIAPLAHITGGGFPDNLPRVLPSGLGVALDLSAFHVPPVFRWLARDRRHRAKRNAAHVQLRHRHGGRGVRAPAPATVEAALRAVGEKPVRIGEVVEAGAASAS